MLNWNAIVKSRSVTLYQIVPRGDKFIVGPTPSSPLKTFPLPALRILSVPLPFHFLTGSTLKIGGDRTRPSQDAYSEVGL